MNNQDMVHWLTKQLYYLPPCASHGREACRGAEERGRVFFFTPAQITFHASRFTVSLGQTTKFAKQFFKRMNHAQSIVQEISHV
jgi:hypothetical protein